MPETKSLKFGYADDWALLYQSKDIQEIETVLSGDLSILNNYFKQWYLRLNTTKTTTSLFHLDNHQANQILKVNIDNKFLLHHPSPSTLVSHWTIP